MGAVACWGEAASDDELLWARSDEHSFSNSNCLYKDVGHVILLFGQLSDATKVVMDDFDSDAERTCASVTFTFVRDAASSDSVPPALKAYLLRQCGMLMNRLSHRLEKQASSGFRMCRSCMHEWPKGNLRNCRVLPALKTSQKRLEAASVPPGAKSLNEGKDISVKNERMSEPMPFSYDEGPDSQSNAVRFRCGNCGNTTLVQLPKSPRLPKPKLKRKKKPKLQLNRAKPGYEVPCEPANFKPSSLIPPATVLQTSNVEKVEAAKNSVTLKQHYGFTQLTKQSQGGSSRSAAKKSDTSGKQPYDFTCLTKQSHDGTSGTRKNVKKKKGALVRGVLGAAVAVNHGSVARKASKLSDFF